MEQNKTFRVLTNIGEFYVYAPCEDEARGEAEVMLAFGEKILKVVEQ